LCRYAEAMRAFIACVRGSDHTIGKEASADIEAAMVAARQGEEKATQEQFHRWLTMVGLYKLNAVDPKLESAWFQTLNLKCDM
jgi:hypothetical protein